MKNRFYDEDNFPEDLFPNYRDEDEGEGEGYDREEPYGDDYDDRERDEIAQAIELERRDLNQKIFFRTVRTLEKSWLWYFYSTETKNRMILENYHRYMRLILDGEHAEILPDYDE